MSKLLEQYHREYNFLYDNEDRVIGYKDALNWYNDNHKKPEVAEYITAIVKEQKDFIASDREAVAFAFALEALGIIR